MATYAWFMLLGAAFGWLHIFYMPHMFRQWPKLHSNRSDMHRSAYHTSNISHMIYQLVLITHGVMFGSIPLQKVVFSMNGLWSSKRTYMVKSSGQLLSPLYWLQHKIILKQLYALWRNFYGELCSFQVIIGSQEGLLQLWNISTKKKLYEFKGWNSSVHCCVSSPALDVVAVGCADGKVHVHNVRYDKELVSFTHSIRGAVTALSFRTGNTLNGFKSLMFCFCFFLL